MYAKITSRPAIMSQFAQLQAVDDLLKAHGIQL